MIKLYYTGATKAGEIQPKKEFALGGYISTSLVPNNQLANLFSTLSKYSIDNELFEVIGIALKNETGVKVFDVTLYIDYPIDAYCKIEVAPIIPAGNETDGFYVERIINNYSEPYLGAFEEINGVANAVNIGDIEINEYIVLWMKRSIDTVAVALLNDCDTLNANYNANTPIVTREDLALKISWEEGSV